MRTLDYHKQAFNSVGWFIPPYVMHGFATLIAKQINDNSAAFDQQKLEKSLAHIYSADNLAAMVCERYPITQYIRDYKQIISESVEAHFLGLDHIAVSGLMPVIEGVAIKIAASIPIPTANVSTKNLFCALAADCKDRAIKGNIGAVGEILSMMDSFIEFTEKHLYVRSELYPLEDKTNRHGILHGAYCDEDYGRPLNFYKAIASIDFLCFASGFITSYMPCFAPDHTKTSQQRAAYYRMCNIISNNRSRLTQPANATA